MIPIRVMVVEDHQQARVALATVLNLYLDIELVGEVANGEEALALCEHTAPDVVLMSLELPGFGAVATTHAIKQHFPTVRVLVLTFFGEHKLVTQILQAGARGYLLKEFTGQELHEAIQRVNAGQAV